MKTLQKGSIKAPSDSPDQVYSKEKSSGATLHIPTVYARFLQTTSVKSALKSCAAPSSSKAFIDNSTKDSECSIENEVLHHWRRGELWIEEDATTRISTQFYAQSGQALLQEM